MNEFDFVEYDNDTDLLPDWQDGQADAFYDRMADYYDQQEECNLVNWGSESLEDIDHDW